MHKNSDRKVMRLSDMISGDADTSLRNVRAN